MRAEVLGVVLGRGGVPTKLTLRIGEQEAELSLSAVWRALAKHPVKSVDPLKIPPRGMRIAIMDRDDRPNFATAKRQRHGTIFVRTEDNKGDCFLPHELARRIFQPAHLPLLAGRWMLAIRDRLNPRLPTLPSVGSDDER